MKFPKLFVIALTITTNLISLHTFSAEKKAPLLDQTLKKYRNAKMIRMDVIKKIKSELMGKESKYEGSIHLGSGKFRWENQTPEHTLLLFDGKTILNVQYPPKEFKAPVQVAKAKVNKQTKNQILIATLLDKNSNGHKFKVLSETKQGEHTILEMKPPGEDLTVQNFRLKIEGKSQKILEISYKDDVGNLTTMQFKNIQFLSKLDGRLFQYKIPKDAQVTNL